MKLEAGNLTRIYRGQTVLSDISLTLDSDNSSASIAWFIGPSGSGKSTLLRLLAGLEPPSSGAVLVDGSPLGSRQSDLVGYRRNISVVFQQSNLFPHLSALENISLPLRVACRMEPQQAKQRARECLSRFGMAEHEMKKPSQLSGGQQQRVAIARAISADPAIIFLDEPTSALDPENTVEVLEAIRTLSQQGVQLVLVTHELRFASHLGGLAFFLDEGRVIESGPVESILSRPQSPRLQKFVDYLGRY